MDLSELKSLLNKAVQEKRKADDFVNELSNMSEEDFNGLVYSVLSSLKSPYVPNGTYAINSMREDGQQKNYYEIMRIDNFNEWKYNRLGLSFAFTLVIKCSDYKTKKGMFIGYIDCKYNFHQKKLTISYDRWNTTAACADYDYLETVKNDLLMDICNNLKIKDYTSKSRL